MTSRPKSLRSPSFCFYTTTITLLVLSFCVNLTSADSSCSDGSSYFCPNCGGIEVEDCFDCDGFLSTDTVHDICFDRKLFQPTNNDPSNPSNHYHYLWNDIVGAIVWFLTAGVAMACGVGGGGIYVPLGILLFQFAPKQASGLSQASIFGASLGGILLNGRSRHPNKKIRHDPGVMDEAEQRTVQVELSKQQEKEYVENGGSYYRRPLIHFDMALFLAPMEMAGAVLGVLIQKILPNWLYLLIAGLVLSFTSYKTYKKFFAANQKEQEVRQKRAEEEQQQQQQQYEEAEQAPTNSEDTVESPSGETLDSTEECSSDLEEMTVNPAKDGKVSRATSMTTEVETGVEQVEIEPNDGVERSIDDTKQSSTDLRKLFLQDDMRQYPKEKIGALVVLWIGLLVLTLMKGGKGVESLVGITCESPWYAVLITCQFVWIFGFAIFFGLKLLKKQDERVAVQYPYLLDDPAWDRRSLRFYGGFTFIAGVVAGLIGIGRGMVLGPLMLIMGIHPRVSSAMTATMIVLTSSSVAVIFVTSGLVPWSYAVFYFFVCLIGALVGKSLIDGYMKRTGRASILIFILATIIALATVGCFVILFTRLADKGWCFDGFNKFCSVTDDEECAATRMLALLTSYM